MPISASLALHSLGSADNAPKVPFQLRVPRLVTAYGLNARRPPSHGEAKLSACLRQVLSTVGRGGWGCQ